MNDITELFLQLIAQVGSVDIAEAEFKRLLHEDSDLLEEYREWCESVGTSVRNGFKEFCEEYLNSQDDIYESLTDYDE